MAISPSSSPLQNIVGKLWLKIQTQKRNDINNWFVRNGLVNLINITADNEQRPEFEKFWLAQNERIILRI
jgi:hypothetical protein